MQKSAITMPPVVRDMKEINRECCRRTEDTQPSRGVRAGERDVSKVLEKEAESLRLGQNYVMRAKKGRRVFW